MIRVGMIGAGGIAGAHLAALKARSDVEIAALCDTNQEMLQRRRNEFGGRPFADFKAMLDEAELDAVWLCTPPRVREQPLVECAKRGLPVFCEKPVERDPARGRRIAAQLKRLKARVQVGYVLRASPAVKILQNEMRDDRIHLVASLYACNVSLSKSLRPWFYDKAKSGGALVDQATHNLDLLRLLCGEVESVRGFASNPVRRKTRDYTIDEVISLSFLFKDGAAGCHVHTWVGDAWRNEMVFSGEKRIYRLDLGKGELAIEEGKNLRLFRPTQATMYAEEDAAFIETLVKKGARHSLCDYEDGLATLELTLRCDRALSVSAGTRPK